MKKIIPHSLGTHGEVFHADEITACALLVLYGLVDKTKIFRTRDTAVLERCEFVCDVGGIYDPAVKRFDHHQVSYQGNLSSAGMILLYLKERNIISADLYDYYNDSLVIGVDAHDNGLVKLQIGFCSFSQVVSNFLPLHRESDPELMDQCFYEALDFVLGHLSRLKERFAEELHARTVIGKLMGQSDKYIVCDESLSWVEAFFAMGGEQHPALYIVMPSGKHWKLRAIPPTLDDRMNVRRPLPVKWAGLRDEALEKASGVPGAIFCHKGLFISIWETREAALRALKVALEE